MLGRAEYSIWPPGAAMMFDLLRITELVQALGQPQTGTMAGLLSRDIIRPAMKFTPNFVKTPIFNSVMQYSLGLPNRSA